MPHASALPPPASTESLDISFSEDMLSRPFRFLAGYGDAFRVFSLVTQGQISVFSPPEHVRHILVDNHQNYTKGNLRTKHSVHMLPGKRK